MILPAEIVVEEDNGDIVASDVDVENSEIVASDDDIDAERLLREREEAQNAHYSFETVVNDRINDNAISRQETRTGLALKGMYSYSDGFFKRTIHYEADENGYRVVRYVL